MLKVFLVVRHLRQEMAQAEQMAELWLSSTHLNPAQYTEDHQPFSPLL